jgi:hypothetical protein
VRIANEENALGVGVERLGEPSSFACPECHGVLLQLRDGGRFRFRCHTGHAYSPDSLLAEITQCVGASLWNAIRATEESAMLLRHMARHYGDGDGEPFLARAGGAPPRLADQAGRHGARGTERGQNQRGRAALVTAGDTNPAPPAR